MLLKGAAKDMFDNRWWTPLYTTVVHGHVAAALALMAGGADIHLRHGELETPVAYQAAQLGHVENLKAAVAYWADVDAGDKKFSTALHMAAKNNEYG